MKKLLIILFLTTPIFTNAQFVEDTWTGQDKFSHFAVCTTLSTLGGMGVYEVSDAINFDWGKRNANIIGAFGTMGFGIWKEKVDSKPSYQDLAFDLLGCATGALINDWWQKKYSTVRNVEKEEYDNYLQWKKKQDGR